MNLEELTQVLTSKMPKPMLVVLVIGISVILLLLLNPPHTICDTQKENLKNNQKGILFPTKVGKNTYPGQILKAREICRQGNSSGACYEYLSILKKTAQMVKNGNSECTADVLTAKIEKYEKTESYETIQVGGKLQDEVSSVSYKDVSLERVFTDAMELLVFKAWGEKTPQPGVAKFGWLQEYELGVFCHVQDILKDAKGSSGFNKLQKDIFKKLPGELPSTLAASYLSEADIKSRSLFTIPCNRFR